LQGEKSDPLNTGDRLDADVARFVDELVRIARQADRFQRLQLRCAAA